jgi:hypothetical protein
MPSRRIHLWVCLSSLLFASVAAGQTLPLSASGTTPLVLANEPKAALKEGKIVRAVHATSPPSLDGRLDDEVWTLAPAASGFVQRDPDNGQPMTRATRIQIAYDNRYLYVAANVRRRQARPWSTAGYGPALTSSRRPTC